MATHQAGLTASSITTTGTISLASALNDITQSCMVTGPSIVSALAETGGVVSVGESVAGQLTGGITGTSRRVGLANKSANMVVEDNHPVFYLVFSGGRKVMNEVAELLLLFL